MTFRGDDLTTPATPDTSQAPEHGFPGSHPYTCVGRWAGLVGWLRGRLMVAGLSPINSRNLIIVGRCSPSLQPKRQATWWPVTAISAAVFFVGDPNETYREWNVESQSLARWPRCTDRSFWWHRPDCFCGPAALRQSGGVRQLPIPAPILSRSACCYVAARCSARMSTARSGRPAENVSGSRPRVPIDRQHFSPP